MRDLYCPQRVRFLLLVMMSAVELDRELPFGTGKVDDVAANRMLPTRSPIWKALSERIPYPAFNLRCVAA